MEIKVCKARTVKWCSMKCGYDIKEKEQFIRIGDYPNDRTIHFNCLADAIQVLKGDVAKLEHIYNETLMVHPEKLEHGQS